MSGIWLIVRRSLRQHLLSTVITVLAVALGSGLVMAVFNVNAQAYRAFTGGDIGFDAVLGARGSQLQLVLNTVFHLETSPGNIPWSLYQEIKNDNRVELAIPYAVGDNYRNFRLVGTVPKIFTEFEYQEGRKFQTDTGQVFLEDRREAIVGSIVAERTGLKAGDTFSPYHGVTYNEREKHDERYTVVGIMKPTNTPSDRVIWIPIEGIYRMGGHVLRGSDGETYTPERGVEIPDEHKEVSAVMLKFRSQQAGFFFHQMINLQGKVATLAWPIGQVMADLFDKLGWMNRVLQMVAYLVVVVAAGSILASIYNTMNERRREFAILRALGARKRTVFSAIVAEAATIATLGALLGLIVYGLILAAAREVIQAQTGVVLTVAEWHPSLGLTPLGMLVLGALAGVVPAWKAYATDVAEHLGPSH